VTVGWKEKGTNIACRSSIGISGIDGGVGPSNATELNNVL
jgi:hypothetical protein